MYHHFIGGVSEGDAASWWAVLFRQVALGYVAMGSRRDPCLPFNGRGLWNYLPVFVHSLVR
jgi:hypothetical protein